MARGNICLVCRKFRYSRKESYRADDLIFAFMRQQLKIIVYLLSQQTGILSILKIIVQYLKAEIN